MSNKSSKRTNDTNRAAKKSKIKKANMFLACTVSILLLVVLGSVGYVYSKNKSMRELVEVNTIYYNIYINDMDVGGMTVDEAKDMLKNSILQPLQNKKVVFTYEGKNWEITYDKLKANYDIDKTVNEAYNIARDGSLEERYELVKNLSKNPQKFNMEYTFDSKILEEFVKQIETEINVEMKNSEMQRVNGTFSGTPEQVGQKLNSQQAVDAATSAIKAQKEQTIALVVDKIMPQYTAEYFSKMNNNIGSFSTIINNSAGGITNIKLASSRINDTLMYPGDVFSYYETLGPTTAAAGFKDAPVIINGKLEDGIGGGVCQVSSTLYNAVLYAELEIVERHNHSRPVGYVEKGRDATMAGDYLDFKFKNSTDYPIYIESYVEGTKLTVNLYGNEIHSAGRTLKFESVVTEILEPPAEKVIEDSSLPAGQRQVVSQPKQGYKVKVYRLIYQDGNLLDKTQINTSTYKPARGEVKIGTKKAEVPTETKPAEPTVPSTEAPTESATEAVTQESNTETVPINVE